MKKYVFGVDIGGTTIKMGLFRTTGELLEKWEIPTCTEEKGRYILGDIAKAIEDKLARKEISKMDVEGIGIGVPGSDGAGGEIGHLHMTDNETAGCGCGNQGCLEQYVSANGGLCC